MKENSPQDGLRAARAVLPSAQNNGHTAAPSASPGCGDRASAVIEAALVAIVTIDEQGRVLDFNAAAERLLGCRRADAIGRELSDLVVPAREREQAIAAFARYLHLPSSDRIPQSFVAEVRNSSGAELSIDVTITPLASGTPGLFALFAADRSEYARQLQALGSYQRRVRKLVAELLVAEERERRRLAVDLHDGLSQTIALAQMKLSELRTAADTTHLAALDEISGLIASANRAARSISFELSPPVLHDLGLEPAVAWLVESISSRYGIEIELRDDRCTKPTDERTRVILYRSIRELLINAAKHSKGKRVLVLLERQDDQVRATVEDDGVGMVQDLTGLEGFGLLSIRERLSYVGGSMSLESSPGNGTRVMLSAPVADEQTTNRSSPT